MNKVFVYGTLKKGHGNHPFLADQKYLGKGEIGKEFTLYRDTILPYLVRKDGEGAVGEVYEVQDERMPMLDMLEGHPHVYNREKVEIKIDGEKDTAWVYVFPFELLKSHVEELRKITDF